MKSKIIAICIILIIAYCLYLFDRFSFAKDQTTIFPSMSSEKLEIAIIGDSWAADQKLDTIVQNSLYLKGISSEIFSWGKPGATTKKIYKRLLSSSTIFIQPKYCVVVCGVNDAVSQLGEKFYAHHMALILKLLLANNIKPVLVTVPEFAIQEASQKAGIISHSMHNLYASINRDGKLDNISDYRKALAENLIRSGLKNSILQINFDSVCTDYYSNKELYSDFAHLSLPGNQKLGGHIAELISKDFKANVHMSSHRESYNN